MKVITEVDHVPVWTIRSLENCFKWIPEIDLVGLDHIKLFRKLTDFSPEGITIGRTKCKDEGLVISAVYSAGKRGDPAFISFFIQAMYFPLERFVRFPPLTTIYFSRIVAHEVGHHLVANRGYIFTPDEKYGSPAFEEEMANRYAFEIASRMKQRRYYRTADRILKYFSKVYFEEGRQMWKSEKFDAAATSWYKSWLLDNDNDTAGDLFWQARKKAGL